MSTFLNGRECVVNDLCIFCSPADHVVDLRGKAVQLVKQAGHTVGKLLGGGGTVSKTGIGLKLTGNAAHILAPLDGAGVGALGNLAGLQSGNAAHVVADVLVSHRACVAAAPDVAAMPPTLYTPVTSAALEQEMRLPLSPLNPTKPPISSWPVTEPRTVQRRTVPKFSPASRPT